MHGISSTTAIEIHEVLLFFHDKLPERIDIYWHKHPQTENRSIILQVIFTQKYSYNFKA
jgi:hypothetical protein